MKIFALAGVGFFGVTIGSMILTATVAVYPVAGSIVTALFLASGLIATGMVLRQRRQLHEQTLCRNADYEHAALMDGRDRLGIFGQHPPANL